MTETKTTRDILTLASEVKTFELLPPLTLEQVEKEIQSAASIGIPALSLLQTYVKVGSAKEIGTYRLSDATYSK